MILGTHWYVCATLSMYFGGTTGKMTSQVDVARVSEPTVLTKFQGKVRVNLDAIPKCLLEQRWSLVQSAMHSACLTSCSVTSRTANT